MVVLYTGLCVFLFALSVFFGRRAKAGEKAFATAAAHYKDVVALPVVAATPEAKREAMDRQNYLASHACAAKDQAETRAHRWTSRRETLDGVREFLKTRMGKTFGYAAALIDCTGYPLDFTVSVLDSCLGMDTAGAVEVLYVTARSYGV